MSSDTATYTAEPLEPLLAPHTERAVDGYAQSLRGQLAALDVVHEAARADVLTEQAATREARETLAGFAQMVRRTQEMARAALTSLYTSDARGVADAVGGLSGGLDAMAQLADQAARGEPMGEGLGIEEAAAAMVAPPDLPPALFDTPANREFCLALQEAKRCADAVADERRSHGGGAAFLIGGLLATVTEEIYGPADSLDGRLEGTDPAR